MTSRTYGLAVALLTMATPLLAQDSAPREFVVHVNEPFLTFETQGGEVRIISPDDPEGSITAVNRLEVAGVAQVVGDYQGERFVVTVVQGPCQDDMAGLAYSHSATLIWGDTFKGGCARLSTEPQPQEGG